MVFADPSGKGKAHDDFTGIRGFLGCDLTIDPNILKATAEVAGPLKSCGELDGTGATIAYAATAASGGADIPLVLAVGGIGCLIGSTSDQQLQKNIENPLWVPTW
jgi:hypothetical protein